MEAKRQVLGFEQPRTLISDLLRRTTPARADGVARGEPFEAVAVVGTRAAERVPGAIVRDPHVPELGVEEPVHQISVRHPAPADP